MSSGMDDPRNLDDPMPADWIDCRAAELEAQMRDELRLRWPKQSYLTRDRLITEVAEKYLNAFWSYQVLTVLGSRHEHLPSIVITQYNGKVDES